jgi:predicted transcriptional regulator
VWLLQNEGTVDEVAEALRENPFSIRPRVTELKNLGLVIDTGQIRQNWSGMDATVWSAVE